MIDKLKVNGELKEDQEVIKRETISYYVNWRVKMRLGDLIIQIVVELQKMIKNGYKGQHKRVVQGVVAQLFLS